MTRTHALLVVACLTASADPFAQVHGAVIPTGTAAIAGRITSSSGVPLRQAQLMLTAADQPLRRSASSDADGRYRFGDLPAGRYVLMVNKPGYVGLQYGQRRPLEPGTALVLSNGQTLNGIDAALERGAVIAGRITDESGEPVVRASVQAMRYVYGPDGERRPQPSEAATTDDLGQFRLFGLAPGEYLVSAFGRDSFTVVGPGVTDTSDTYLTSFYPGTPNISEAQLIPLVTGQETSVQFALATGRLARLAGIVTDSGGKPVANAITTLQTAGGGYMRGVSGGTTDASGAFSIANVAPGEYTVWVQPLNRASGGAPLVEAGTLPITVGGSDLLDLRIRTTPGAVVTGRVVFEGTARRDSGQGDTMRVFTQTTGPLVFPMFSLETGQVADDGSFELRGARGASLFRVTAGAAWTLKRVTLDGVDITDVPTDLNGRETLSGVTVVLTDKITDVSGQVMDGRGQTVKDYLVVLQPVEPLSGPALARALRTVRPDNDGRFHARGLPPGEYLATAVESLERGRHFVPDVRARLRDTGKRFAVREGETVSIDLRLTDRFE